jgi:hypothetical protein
MLDTDNPRHEPVHSQRDALRALIANQRQKLVVLASDIMDNGLSPIDRLLVIQNKNGKTFTVVEGNRRLAALRMLHNPDLAEGTAIAAAIKRIAAGGKPPDEVDCARVGSRQEAAHWMELRHRGEAEGAGTVRWNAFAANRFSHAPGTQAAHAIGFLESVAEGYPKNEVIQDLARRVAEKRLTTLGRLVADPNFRDQCGMKEEDGVITFEFPATALQDFFEHVLGDIAADVTVSQLKSKPQRTDYLNKAPKPDASKRLSDPKPLSEKPSAGAKPKPKPKPKPGPAKPFKDLSLTNLGSKTQSLLREFRSLNVDRTPTACAVLVRSIVELAVEEFIDTKKLQRQGKLKQRIRTCLNEIDSINKDQRFTGVRQGLADGTSLLAVSTLHGFVHNPHFHADGTTVRAFAANVEPFLQELNDRA